MEFAYVAPAPALSHAVKAVWLARGTREEFDHPDPIVPDGCVEIVLNLGDPFYEEVDGRRITQPRDLLVGQMMRPTTARPTGEVDLIGIRLRPSRAGMALSTSMHELNERMVSLSEVWSHGDRLVDDLRGSRRDDRLDVLCRALAQRLTSVDRRRVQTVDHALSLITRAEGAIAIDRVAKIISVSRRQLERLFREHVGLTPKDTARIARVQAALRLVSGQPGLGGAEIAATCGFSDQAHLIHECRAIAGVTPSRFSSSTTTLASLMRV